MPAVVGVAVVGAVATLLAGVVTAIVTLRGQGSTATTALVGQLMQRVEAQEARISSLERSQSEASATILDFALYVVSLWSAHPVPIPAPPARAVPYLPAVPTQIIPPE